MATIIVQVYFCPKCWKVFQVQEQGVYFPPCPYCGCRPVIHRGKQVIETK
jgi:DNA-directed RNA polymerase subunit RPC12/RpoP